MRRANSLVGMLVVLVIMAILAVVFLKGGNVFGGAAGSSRKDGKGTTIPGAALAKAEDTVCKSNLGQVRMLLGMRHDEEPDGNWPTTLEETKAGAGFYNCPLGKEPYKYDPATGNVKCPHPGHERY
jgi:hypothetical protein